GLDHANVVPVYEAGQVGPICYIASAYCPGKNLAAWLRSQAEPVPPRAAARLMVDLARGVQHAHSRGVLHRDLKPANVLLTPRTESRADGLEFIPRLTDFGLAKLLAAAGEVETATGAMLGTVPYMAPEQASGQKQDLTPAVDVYGLGAILYELLTG